MSNVCDLFLERERTTLSKYAFLTENTKGRDFPYVPCENRTEFQRDRDKIIHSESFRRLMNKTQVFLAPDDANYRTRLTHTLEVTQIARIICRALRLNEDLCEAIGLGHDLGHTPFGHAGEYAMQQCYSPDFTHYNQSLRVVERLENNGQGLNLTYEVRDGIVNHTGDGAAETLEGLIVKFADRIAYINHDIDDACRAGILSVEDIPKSIRIVLGEHHGQRINTMVTSVIKFSEGRNEIGMESEVLEVTNDLRKFMFDNVYSNAMVRAEESKAKALLIRLFEYFAEYPERLPDPYLKNTNYEPVERCVCDYIAAMTDRMAIELYKELFIPEVWRG